MSPCRPESATFSTPAVGDGLGNVEGSGQKAGLGSHEEQEGLPRQLLQLGSHGQAGPASLPRRQQRLRDQRLSHELARVK